jgi:predicted nuclease of predicted toxin-antitoxin system
MDVHVPAAITRGLLLRGVDVLTAQLDGTTELSDPELLDRATALGRVLFSQDEDLLAEATLRQRGGQPFAGLIYAHQLRVTLGKCIADLELLALAGTPDDFTNRVEYLPL